MYNPRSQLTLDSKFNGFSGVGLVLERIDQERENCQESSGIHILQPRCPSFRLSASDIPHYRRALEPRRPVALRPHLSMSLPNKRR